MVRMFLF